MNMHQILQNITHELPETLASAVVDLANGIILDAVHTVPYFTQAYIDAVAAAAVEMFRGRNVHAVEQMLSMQRGEAFAYHTYKVQMKSSATYHFLCLIDNKPDMLFVLVTTREINTGMGWVKVEHACKELGQVAP